MNIQDEYVPCRVILCFQDNDSNQAVRSDDTDEDPFIKPEVPGIIDETAKPDEWILEYISNLGGNEI